MFTIVNTVLSLYKCAFWAFRIFLGRVVFHACFGVLKVIPKHHFMVRLCCEGRYIYKKRASIKNMQ